MLLICIRYDCLNSSALEEHNVRFNFLDTIEVGKELCTAKFICSIFGPLFIYCVYRTVKCLLNSAGCLQLRAAHQHYR